MKSKAEPDCIRELDRDLAIVIRLVIIVSIVPTIFWIMLLWPM